MALQSLLLCPDEKTARVLSRVLSELEIAMEQCTEPFDAVKKLMRQRYDAVIVDWENEANATLVLKNARMSPSNKTSLAVAIVEGQTSVRNAFRAGANFVLYKPISLEQAKTSLRAARALMQRGAEAAKGQAGESAEPGPTLVPPRMAPVTSMPSQPFSAPGMSASDSSWGAGTAAAPAKQPGTPLDDLRNLAGTALDNLTPAVAAHTSPTVIAPVRGNAADVKPFPLPKKEEEDGFYKLDLDADPAAAPQPRKKTRAPEVTAEIKATVDTPRLSSAPQVAPKAPAAAETYALQTTAEPVKSPFDEVRSRVAAKPPRPAPSSFDSTDEEASAGIPKPILFGGVAVIAMVVLVFVLMHFRSASKAQPAAQAVPQQQPVTTQEAPSVSPVTPVPAPVNVAPIPQVPALKGEVKTGKELLPKPSATKPAAQPASEVKAQVADDTADQQPEVEVHKLAPLAKSAPRAEVPDAAPPSMDAVAGVYNPDVGGIMQSPVAVPTLVAPDRVRISQGVSQGMVTHMVKPMYPETARAMHLQGAVVLDALIAKDGSIKTLKVAKGHPVLARAAEDAVKQWQYKPYLLNGQPVEVETQIIVNFKP